MSHAAPKFTIAIPTWNRAGHLSQALRYATRQSYENLDIVVYDNASTDETPLVIERIGDPRVRYFRHPENVGPIRNYLAAADKAIGDYTSFLQDDDQINCDFVRQAVACFEAHPDAVL